VRKGIGIFLVLFLASEALWAQQPLPITRVLLYKNGMAYVVRSGQIAAPVSLTFHPEDMNDVLKSFTAWNPDSGALYSVGYTTGIPSSRTLSRFPFDISAPQTGLGGFLVQMKGADLRLDHNGKDVQGKLVAVQETDRVTAPQTSTKDYRLTVLLRDGSMQAMWLSDVRAVEFVDPQLRDQLRTYLDVLAAGRQDVTREVSVYPVPTPGAIEVAYLQQFPLWKTSYRIDLGEKENRIQGWAQIDNPTGEAWDNVRVSLLSGAPVSFVMNLYDPLFTTRSRIAVPGGQVAAPRQYESAVRTSAENVAVINPDLVGEIRQVFTPGDAELGRGNGQIQITTRSGTNSYDGFSATFQAPDSAPVGDFFEYQFPFPVRIASRQSALLPFLQKTLNVERLSIFNGRTDKGNARLGARIDNNTDVPLEAGPVTFFQQARYSGEAVLDYLPRGEKRLISYGVDYDIQVASKREGKPEVTTRLTVNKGIAVLFKESALMTTYEVRNKGIERKTLVIEHPRNGKLKGIEPFETTEGFYRFRVALAPGESVPFEVSEVVSRTTRLSLDEMEREDLLKFSGKETPQAVRQRLGQIVDFQEQLEAMRTDLKETQSGIDTLFRDQERLRENLKALRDNSEDQQLRVRYLDQLKKQEDRIDVARAHMESVTKDIASTQTKLSDLISNLTFQD
jgi:hypothetical protein